MKRVYRNKNITVYWDSDKCTHSAICVRKLPQVFRVKGRPWVDLQACDAELIRQVVEECPSGALTCKKNPQNNK